MLAFDYSDLNLKIEDAQELAFEKRFLFLQSHPSNFGRELLQYMRKSGAVVHAINISSADWAYRLGVKSDSYWGRLSGWRTYLEHYIEAHGITDIVYYADRRPYHRIAHAIAQERGLNAYAYEFGYMRPDWITLEKGGLGAFSHFPEDPNQIVQAAAELDHELPGGHYPYPFLPEAFNEVAYNLGPVFAPMLFPFFERDRYYHPLRDYISYIPRLMVKSRNNVRATAAIEALKASGEPYFVVPMQLQNDYQIRHNSHYTHLSEFIRDTLESFEIYADKDTRLVFKLHPLDNNIERWPRAIMKLARTFGLQERVDVIDGGNLAHLLADAKGVVLVNSTTGVHAVRLHVPVKVMGIATYDIPGLTDPQSIDGFWQNPRQPNEELLDATLKLMSASIQVKGNFFTKPGKAVAIPEFARRLMTGDINGHGAYVPVPPRLQRARRMNVPIPADCYEWSSE